jgi:Tfp pilus assembly protein PilO
MSRAIVLLKPWMVPTLSVCFAVLAGAYALSKQQCAGASIRELEQLAAELSGVSGQAQAGSVSPIDAEALRANRQDLERRMEESTKPGMVQAELMASAKKAGLDVREVQPISAHSSEKGAGTFRYPIYRVSVQGSYPQIAEYLHLCRAQRVPARPTGFRVGPTSASNDVSGGRAGGLQAEITMEAFQPRPAESAGKPAQAGK